MKNKENIINSSSETGLEETDLSIEVVSQAAQELALDWVLLGEQGQVVTQFVVGGDDGALTILVKLWTPCTAKNLHDIQDAQIHQCAAFSIIDLSTLL